VCDPQSPRRIQTPQNSSAPRLNLLKKAKIRRGAQTALVLDPVQENRYQALRQWRRLKAAELDSPAFVVFSDRTLRELAVKNPRTMDELRGIHGIGDSKLEKFGWDLLAEMES
jgi:ATP-dependent DNA helicase RecQ